jgi:hypothetical protein
MSRAALRSARGSSSTALMGAVAILVAGCGSNGSTRRVSGSPAPQAGPKRFAFASQAAERAARDCHRVLRDGTSSRKAQRAIRDRIERQLRSAFVGQSNPPIHLLMEGSAFRPGAQFTVAVANDSGKGIGYGPPTSIESVRTGRTVRVKGLGFTLPLYSVAPGAVGLPCDSVFVPSSVPPGLYRAVVGVTALDRPTAPHPQSVSAEFRVQGPPLPHPKWEVLVRHNVKAKREARARASGSG